MIIKEGSAQEIYSWFVTGQSGYDVLCIFLCKDSEQVNSLTQLVNDSFSLDTIIRDKVGFLFIFNGVKEALGLIGNLGEVHVIPGYLGFREANPKTTRVGDFLEAYDQKALKNEKDVITKEIGSIIAKNTANAVPNFCDFFSVHYSDLPGMLTFYKGYEEVQYYKFDHYSAEDIKSFFIAIVEIQQKIESHLIHKRHFSFEIQGKLVASRELLIEVEGKKNKIEKCIVGMCERHQISGEDCKQILSVLLNTYLKSGEKTKSCEQFEEKYPISQKDGRLLKALKMSKRLSEVWNDGKDLVSPNELVDIQAQLEEEKTKISLLQAELREFLKNYQGKRAILRHSRVSSSWNKIETANTSWDVVDKLVKLVKFVIAKIPTGGV